MIRANETEKLQLMFKLMDRVPDEGIAPMLADLEAHIYANGIADMVESADVITQDSEKYVEKLLALFRRFSQLVSDAFRYVNLKIIQIQFWAKKWIWIFRTFYWEHDFFCKIYRWKIREIDMTNKQKFNFRFLTELGKMDFWIREEWVVGKIFGFFDVELDIEETILFKIVLLTMTSVFVTVSSMVNDSISGIFVDVEGLFVDVDFFSGI